MTVVQLNGEFSPPVKPSAAFTFGQPADTEVSSVNHSEQGNGANGVGNSHTRSTRLGICRQLWYSVSVMLRILCFTLLIVMFSVKVKDYLSFPVVSSTDLAHSPLPYITICPAKLNGSVLDKMKEAWEFGIVNSDQVLDACEVPFNRMLLEYFWAGCPLNSSICGQWRRFRVPPGITCYRLRQPRPSVDRQGSHEITLGLAIPNEASLSDTGGLYTIFAHGEPTPKSFYGGRLLSSYHVLQIGTFTELVLTWTEWQHVNHPLRPCIEDKGYDPNKCLLDCYGQAAFEAANCTVDWGAEYASSLPVCATRDDYRRMERAWAAWQGREQCDCPEPCTYHSIGITPHMAKTFTFTDDVRLQLRFNFRQLLVRERVSYGLVDLLVDLGGTLGLLLGYSLVSLVDLGDTLVDYWEKNRNRGNRRNSRVAWTDQTK